MARTKLMAYSAPYLLSIVVLLICAVEVFSRHLDGHQQLQQQRYLLAASEAGTVDENQHPGSRKATGSTPEVEAAAAVDWISQLETSTAVITTPTQDEVVQATSLGGANVTLDGSHSTPKRGARITSYTWVVTNLTPDAATPGGQNLEQERGGADKAVVNMTLTPGEYSAELSVQTTAAENPISSERVRFTVAVSVPPDAAVQGSAAASQGVATQGTAEPNSSTPIGGIAGGIAAGTGSAQAAIGNSSNASTGAAAGGSSSQGQPADQQSTLVAAGSGTATPSAGGIPAAAAAAGSPANTTTPPNGLSTPQVPVPANMTPGIAAPAVTPAPPAVLVPTLPQPLLQPTPQPTPTPVAPAPPVAAPAPVVGVNPVAPAAAAVPPNSAVMPPSTSGAPPPTPVLPTPVSIQPVQIQPVVAPPSLPPPPPPVTAPAPAPTPPPVSPPIPPTPPPQTPPTQPPVVTPAEDLCGGSEYNLNVLEDWCNLKACCDQIAKESPPQSDTDCVSLGPQPASGTCV